MLPILIFISVSLVASLVYFSFKLNKIKTKLNTLKTRFDNLQRLSQTGYFDGYFIDDDVWWSEELNKLVGLKPEEYITKKADALNLIFEEDREEYIKQLENSIATGQPLRTEYRGKNIRTGEIRHYWTNVEVIKDEEGKPIGLRGTVQDNTEKKAIQKALSESEVKQANVMSNIDDLIFIVDENEIFIDYYNSSTNDILYKMPKDFLYKHHSEVLPESISQTFAETIKQIKTDGKSRQVDYSMDINGEKKWNNVKVSIYKGIEGKKEGYIVVARDYTERKKIEEELIENEINFKSMMESLPVAVMEVDLEGNIVYVNGKTMEWFGYTKEEFLSSLKTFDLVVPSQRMLIKENLKSRIKNPDLGPVEYTGMKKNGENFDVILFASAIKTNEELSGFRGVLMDISERNRHLSEIQKITKLESLGILAGGIAHNFKNILAAITLSVDVIKMSPLSIEKQLNRISSSLEQANALATRFQTFTKSNEPSLQTVNVNDIVVNAVEIALAGSSNMTNMNLDNNLFPTVADGKQLNEVFLNLLINANQAMTSSGIITITTDNVTLENNEIQNLLAGEYIRIVIEDEGVGIEDDAIEEIFTPFYTTKKDGQGLGLPTVYYIIKNHNGAITVESEVNKGTKFSIYLKRLEQSEDKIKTIEKKKVKKSFAKTRVLLVDDDINITNSMIDIAEVITDIEIHSFNNPIKAINFFKESLTNNPIDVAILDMTLVGYEIDGLDVLNEIRKLDPNIKALVFSGHSSKPVVSHYHEFGFNGRLEKPCSFYTLVETINDVLGS